MIMQKKEAAIERIAPTLVGGVLAFIIVTTVVLLKSVLLPALRFIAKQAFVALRKLAARRSSRGSSSTRQLPTPDIFKDARNLGPAREFRF
jgi:hypothetical protein